MEEAEATPQGENSHGTEGREETAIAPAYTAAGTTGRGACSGTWGLRCLRTCPGRRQVAQVALRCQHV